MVIQGNMSPKDIVGIWSVTEIVFREYEISITTKTLNSLVDKETLSILLVDLNRVVGSSAVTCIEGG